MDEWRQLRTIAVVILAVCLVIVTVGVVSCVTRKSGENRVQAAELVKSIADLDETEKKAFFERVAGLVELNDGVLSERRYVERKASEEGTDELPTDETDVPGSTEGVPVKTEAEQVGCVAQEVSHSVDVVKEVVPSAQSEGADLFSVADLANGLYRDCPAEIIYEFHARLKANGIEWWLPYALAQSFQESRWLIGAENTNGLDKGILQYRITYWSSMCVQHGYPADTSVFDWRVQIAIYAADTARRLASGCSVEDTISRHKQSDYGSYDGQYVGYVMRWVR